ncbi:MAG: hypothetical protein KDC80_07275 [Saprospiraceae bacterium]|nr:hypothetical protein [Saprospiraceae bacterium]
MISNPKQRRIFARIVVYSFLVVLPFVVLIRGSIYLHEAYFFYPYPAIFGGFMLTAVLLAFYLIFLFGTQVHFVRNRMSVILVVLLSYGIYAMVYISGANVKSTEIASEYSSLHPILRLGITTLILLDKDLIVTDADRVYEDYGRMGLSAKKHSLHYRQQNGFVHAVDIRTNGRSEIRNFLLKIYFRGMGFRVLRHDGSGDHLHVSLVSHDRPFAQ